MHYFGSVSHRDIQSKICLRTQLNPRILVFVRRQYVTHPRFQITFTVFFAFGTTFIFVVLGLATFARLFLLSKDPLLFEDQRTMLVQGAITILAGLGVMGVLVVALFTLFGFFLSYKFVGPLYRLENWLESQVQKPNSTPIKLRPGDELAKIAGLLQEAVSTVMKKDL